MTTLGMYASAAHVLLVLERRTVMLWTANRALSSEVSLEMALESLLGEARQQAARARELHVVLGPGFAQLKRLVRLPPLHNERLVRELVAALPERHFATAGEVMLSNALRQSGHWWIAAGSSKALIAVMDAAARHRIRVRSVRPVAAVLAEQAIQSSSVDALTWTDDGITQCVRCERAELVEATRLPADADSARVLDDALAMARQVARTSGRPPFSLHLSIVARPGRSRRLVRAASIAMVACSCVVALLGPGLSAKAERRRASREMDNLRSEARVVAREQYALSRDAMALNRLRAFAASRRLVSPLLAALSVQLPESTAIVSFRLDTLGGSLVALSGAGADLVTAVSATEGVRDAQLSAPITRETMGSTELQRVGLRFWFHTAKRNQGAKRR